MSLVMASTASDVYVALGGDGSRRFSRAMCDEHTKPRRQGTLAALLRVSGLHGPPSRCPDLISAKYVTRQAGECLSGLAWPRLGWIPLSPTGLGGGWAEPLLLPSLLRGAHRVGHTGVLSVCSHVE